MNHCQGHAVLLAACFAATALCHAAEPPKDAADARIIAQATGGQFKAAKGKYFEKGCNEQLDYQAEVVDLNGDGQPEVFISVQGSCLGGMTGVQMNLFIKASNGRWQRECGFPGVHSILKSRSKGFPDIEVGGPGNCFPVWRWNGQLYAPHKKCR